MTLEDTIKQSKKTLGEKINCTLEILSPVHIGSGVKLKKDFDFFSSNQTTTIIPQDVLMEHLKNNPQDLQKFNHPNFRPIDLLKSIKNGRKHDIPTTSEDLLEFERNGNGIPYIPGSSVKGAIRTALLKKEFDTININECHNILKEIEQRIVDSERRRQKLKNEIAGEPLTNGLFNVGINNFKDKIKNNANFNLLRTLSITDINFKDDDIELNKVKILSLSGDINNLSYRWKDMIIFPEMLTYDSKAKFTIKLDSFLFNDQNANSKLHFEVSKYTIDELFLEINNYSYDKIKQEIDFFEKFNKKELEGLIYELKELLNSIPNQNDTKTCILRLGWGSGWKSMTGDLLDNVDFKKSFDYFRDKYKLGRNNYPVFPKTRKIVYYLNSEKNEVPLFLCGWVKITRDN